MNGYRNTRAQIAGTCARVHRTRDWVGGTRERVPNHPRADHRHLRTGAPGPVIGLAARVNGHRNIRAQIAGTCARVRGMRERAGGMRERVRRMGMPVPAYAIDDETAIKVDDGRVEIVSEGHWRCFDRLGDA